LASSPKRFTKKQIIAKLKTKQLIQKVAPSIINFACYFFLNKQENTFGLTAYFETQVSES